MTTEWMLTFDEITKIGSDTVKRVKTVKESDCYEAEIISAIEKEAQKKLLEYLIKYGRVAGIESDGSITYAPWVKIKTLQSMLKDLEGK